ncbi:hypothetical protein B5M09_007761 [Aphanomyces astaci]|uniref:Uncharacterized protein n=1 Tax=Aphanomyces astaci TaxID=112090 RepID=A0A3R7WFT8_APHAT|nr:hypothetical protein B5M09_007761 [Aphanomyces astaci]
MHLLRLNNVLVVNVRIADVMLRVQSLLDSTSRHQLTQHSLVDNSTNLVDISEYTMDKTALPKTIDDCRIGNVLVVDSRLVVIVDTVDAVLSHESLDAFRERLQRVQPILWRVLSNAGTTAERETMPAFEPVGPVPASKELMVIQS